MEPVTPVLPHSAPIELMVGAHQKEFSTMPSFRTQYTNISRWRLSDEERAHIAAGGDLFIGQLNGNQQLQPVLPMAIPEDRVLEHVLACEEGLGLK